MGLFDFLKASVGSSSAGSHSMPNELTFKSGKAALEYIRACMRTEWKPNNVIVGIVGEPILEGGVLSVDVLLPWRDEGFIALPTKTPIKAVHSPKSGRLALNNSSDIRLLDLKSGDLVSVRLAGQDADFRRLYPPTEGWMAFVIAKNSVTYSMRQGGWLVEKKYEL